MALGTVLHTALTGISSAEMLLGAIAHNLANVETPGFKGSTPRLVTQTPQTQASGAAPSPTNGGSNPVQVGMGTMPGEISIDLAQGQILLDPDPLSLAIQGDGFFILEGPRGERLYTRDGRFGVNAAHELVGAGGRRVLGFGVDKSFQVVAGELAPLTVASNGAAADQTDPATAAFLTGFRITSDGRIRGQFTDGVSRDLGQIRIARFANPGGLEQRGENLYRETPNSGLPVEADPGGSGTGAVLSGATEASNADVAEGLVELSRTAILFRTNLAVLDTTDQLLAELTDLGRKW